MGKAPRCSRRRDVRCREDRPLTTPGRPTSQSLNSARFALRDPARIRDNLERGPALPGFLLSSDPVVDALFEDVERQGAGIKYLVVEGPNVEFSAERRLRLRSQLEDL